MIWIYDFFSLHFFVVCAVCTERDKLKLNRLFRAFQFFVFSMKKKFI